ncbi:UNVERIFIED_CONTAM: ABC transporter I family member 11, chloroplastic [Sesamum radiatum]|uniref:ABC transporter I family member 11, chloroplastic n=1 Tax=Sesamum radiatum TaxID=300843 RepID=A0AAW2P806_SESRA
MLQLGIFQIKDVSYRPPGTEIDLLNGISFSLQEKSFGLIFGRSGSGKTTLLQVQMPDLLILDEPLAGLDWKARADVVKLLKYLKEKLTLLVVSHDLKELASLVDQSWRMEMDGVLKRERLPV